MSGERPVAPIVMEAIRMNRLWVAVVFQSIGEKQQHCKNEDVKHRHSVERPHVERTAHLNPCHRIRRRHDSDNDQSTRQTKTQQADLTVQIELFRGNKSCLRNRKDNPAGPHERDHITCSAVVVLASNRPENRLAKPTSTVASRSRDIPTKNLSSTLPRAVSVSSRALTCESLVDQESLAPAHSVQLRRIQAADYATDLRQVNRHSTRIRLNTQIPIPFGSFCMSWFGR